MIAESGMLKTDRLRIYGLTLLLLTVSLSSVGAQSAAKRQDQAEKAKYRLHPHRLKSSPTGLYIPKDLPDTFTELDKMLSPALRTEMRQGAEQEMIKYHFGLGMWLRNNWGLWKGLRLAKWFNGYRIFHPDDMSGIIFTSYWRYLKHRPVAFEDQVQAYLAYWEKAKIAAEKEKERVVATKATLHGMMMNLPVVGQVKQTVTFPARPMDDVYVRYMAPFAGGILLTAKTFDAKRTADLDFSSQCYFLNLTTMTLHPVRLPEMDRVQEGIVIQGQAYFHGVKRGRDVLLAVHGSTHEPLPLPEDKGLLQLGIEQPGAPESRLLAIRPHTVQRWKGQWEIVCRPETLLPYGVLPPQQLGTRFYFRDEGRGEDDKRLSWLEETSPNTPIYFDEHVGVVGSEGPRWENVWSYTQTPDGALWLVSGEGSQSLLKWEQSAGYRIALYNNAATFDGEILGEDGREDTPAHALAITGLEARPDNGVNAIGPHGLFTILNRQVTPLLHFQHTPHDWIPTHLLSLTNNAFLVGGHFGGIYLFRKGADGLFHIQALQKAPGAPKML